MITETIEWRFHSNVLHSTVLHSNVLHFISLLSIICVSFGVSSPVSATPPLDLSSLMAEHRGQTEAESLYPSPKAESLYPSPEVSDSSFVWRAGQGTYRLGVQAPDHWRVENRNVDGSVWGQYHYMTPDGGQVSVQYNAGGPSPPSTHSDGLFLRLDDGQIGGFGELLSDDPRSHGDDEQEVRDEQEALRSLLQELQVREQVLPYGALKDISEGSTARVRLRAGDIVDEELRAVVTNVQ